MEVQGTDLPVKQALSSPTHTCRRPAMVWTLSSSKKTAKSSFCLALEPNIQSPSGWECVHPRQRRLLSWDYRLCTDTPRGRADVPPHSTALPCLAKREAGVQFPQLTPAAHWIPESLSMQGREYVLPNLILDLSCGKKGNWRLGVFSFTWHSFEMKLKC